MLPNFNGIFSPIVVVERSGPGLLPSSSPNLAHFLRWATDLLTCSVTSFERIFRVTYYCFIYSFNQLIISSISLVQPKQIIWSHVPSPPSCFSFKKKRKRKFYLDFLAIFIFSEFNDGFNAIFVSEYLWLKGIYNYCY